MAPLILTAASDSASCHDWPHTATSRQLPRAHKQPVNAVSTGSGHTEPAHRTPIATPQQADRSWPATRSKTEEK
uniref:Uncharacterized protein n=1 Tax=Anopheles atroparvus TaxID=41427 RepID=A0AAG5D0Q1_ANOAO